jgi:hypothetical protein
MTMRTIDRLLGSLVFMAGCAFVLVMTFVMASLEWSGP